MLCAPGLQGAFFHVLFSSVGLFVAEPQLPMISAHLYIVQTDKICATYKSSSWKTNVDPYPKLKDPNKLEWSCYAVLLLSDVHPYSKVLVNWCLL